MNVCPVCLHKEKRYSRTDTAIEKCADNISVKAIGAKSGGVLVYSDEKYCYVGFEGKPEIWRGGNDTE